MVLKHGSAVPGFGERNVTGCSPLAAGLVYDGAAVVFTGPPAVSATDLPRLLGASRNLGAMILRDERRLTLEHVRTLARHFKVSAGLFIEREG